MSVIRISKGNTFTYSALSNTGTCTLIYFCKKVLPVQAYLIYFWAILGYFISKICIQEEQICHSVRLFHPVPVFDSVKYLHISEI